MFNRSCSAVTWSHHDALGVFCCVRPHCREGSFCTCLPSIRAVHVLDEHVWLETNALIGISEGNSAKGPQLHVPARQTGSRDLTIYRAVCGWLWHMRISSNFEGFGQQTWCLLCTSSTSIWATAKLAVMESSIRGIFIFRKLSRSMENDITLFKKR